MSDRHKAALAEGRAQGYAVRRYLEALSNQKDRRGPKPNTDKMRRRLQEVDAALDSADPVKKLQLVQERLDLREHLLTADARVDIATLEEDFIVAAGPYSTRKGISYDAWRELGVKAAVLKKAGVARK